MVPAAVWREIVFRAGRVLPWLLLLVGLLVLPRLTVAQPAEPPGPDKSKQDIIKQRDQLATEVDRLQGEGKFAQAIAAAEKKLAIEREVFGVEHDNNAWTLYWLTEAYALAGDSDAARKASDERLAIYQKLHGESHWQVTNARLTQAYVAALGKMIAADRQRVRETDQLMARVRTLHNQGKFPEAIESCLGVLTAHQELLGEDDMYHADGLALLGVLYSDLGDFAKAEPQFQRALALQKKLLGENHPEYANTLNKLGSMYEQMGDGAKGEPLVLQALEIRKQALGENHAEFAFSLDKLARIYSSRALYGKAEPLLRQSVEIKKKALGENHRQYAASLNNLASLYRSTENYTQAESLYRQALLVYKQSVGEKHPEYAVTLNNLAVLYSDMGDIDKAERLQKQSLEIKREVWGDQHPNYAISLANLAWTYHDKKDYAQAESLFKQANQIQQKMLGEKHPDYLTSLNSLAMHYLAREDFAHTSRCFDKQWPSVNKLSATSIHYISAACAGLLDTLTGLANEQLKRQNFAAVRKAWQEVLDLQLGRVGEKHWQVADARRQLAHSDQLESLDAVARQKLASASQLLEQVYKLEDQDKFREALPLAEQVHAVHREVLGDQHWLSATSLHTVGFLRKQTGDFAQAETAELRALEIRKSVLGEEHPESIDTLHNLATLYNELGDFVRAEPLYRQAAELRKKIEGEKNLSYARTLNSLATVYSALGDHARCEALYQQSLRIRKEVVGEQHREYGHGLLNLGSHYDTIGDYDKAKPLLLQAVTVYKNALGDRHPDYARGLDYLASLYVSKEDYAQAEPLYRQALAIREEALGKKSGDYGITLNNLANVLKHTGDYGQSEAHYREALAIDQELYGDEHPAFIITLTNLADLYDKMGEFAKAEPLLKQALAIRGKKFGKDHPDYAYSLHFLALHFAAMKDTARAEPFSEAVEIARRYFDRTASIQSERQQLALRRQIRSRLQLYLTLTAQTPGSAAQVYPEVLAWKAPVATKQLQTRRLRRDLAAGGNAETARLFVDLEQATRTLATRSRATPDPSAPVPLREELQELSDTIEGLQQALAVASAEFRHALEAQELSADDIARVLPADVALVDYVEYARFTPPEQLPGQPTWPMHLAAFVVRNNKPVERIELGPVDPINESIDAWRKCYGRKSQQRHPGAELRRLIWQPLPVKVSEARIVLISPSGALARLPFAALPGTKPGTYLIEDQGLAFVPVPRLLTELFSKPRTAQQDPSLLLVGDVNFDTAPGAPEVGVAVARSAPHGDLAGGLLQWSRLPGTALEAGTVTDVFRKNFPEAAVTLLRREDPTEAAIRQQAVKHRYLHLATHGYFAPLPLRAATANGTTPDNLNSAISPTNKDVNELHPGLLSGLVLAGANRPVAFDQDDGILTALEAEALDLEGVELATLSACETGLGQDAGGEGLLGLQRAFHTAGARSVVSGLWKVPDRGTQLLMTRFYDNLWQKKMSKLDALRESQLWMLREASKQPDIARGIDLLPDEESVADGSRLPPYYWGAFILSGDWR